MRSTFNLKFKKNKMNETKDGDRDNDFFDNEERKHFQQVIKTFLNYEYVICAKNIRCKCEE